MTRRRPSYSVDWRANLDHFYTISILKILWILILLHEFKSSVISYRYITGDAVDVAFPYHLNLFLWGVPRNLYIFSTNLNISQQKIGSRFISTRKVLDMDEKKIQRSERIRVPNTADKTGNRQGVLSRLFWSSFIQLMKSNKVCSASRRHVLQYVQQWQLPQASELHFLDKFARSRLSRDRRQDVCCLRLQKTELLLTYIGVLTHTTSGEVREKAADRYNERPV